MGKQVTNLAVAKADRDLLRAAVVGVTILVVSVLLTTIPTNNHRGSEINSYVGDIKGYTVSIREEIKSDGGQFWTLDMKSADTSIAVRARGHYEDTYAVQWDQVSICYEGKGRSCGSYIRTYYAGMTDRVFRTWNTGKRESHIAYGDVVEIEKKLDEALLGACKKRFLSVPEMQKNSIP